MRDDDPRGKESGGVAGRHERHVQGAHDLSRRVDGGGCVGRERHRHRQLGIGRQPRQKTRVHRHAAHECEESASDPEGIDPREREERRFRAARLHQRGARRSRRQEARQRGVGLIVFVAEVPRAHDATRLVLDLQQREPGESHGVTGVVEQVGALAPLQRGYAKPVVLTDGLAQRGEPQPDPRALPVQVRANHGCERGHPLLVFRGQAVRHHHANPPAEHGQGDEHHRAESEEETGAKAHGCVRRSVPSQSSVIRGSPRRTTAWERTSSSGSMVAAELHGGSSSAARHTS